MKKIIVLILFIFINHQIFSQEKKVLFLGNSYTEYFNLPQLLVNISQSTNDVLVVDSNTPGGNTLQGHSTNAVSLAKIAQENWDFVVLQEQSQLPAFPINQVATQVFPFAASLNSSIIAQNPCAETVFYMTWGRQNGDADNCGTNPPVCSYIGMDNLLKERYLTMTNANNAIVSPVSVVWRYIRENHPAMNLYDPDGSHPSILGSYIAACCFYTTILRKNPTLITFNASLSAADATIIKTATKNLVFDNLQEWKVGSYDPIPNFIPSSQSTNVISFSNTSSNANNYLWDFGDGQTATENNPTHTYATAGQYLVKLTASKCGISNAYEQLISTSNLSNADQSSLTKKCAIFPNPTKSTLFIDSPYKIELLELFDIFGRQIAIYPKVKSSFDFSDKNSGIYFMKIHTAKGVQTEKIIKE